MADLSAQLYGDTQSAPVSSVQPSSVFPANANLDYFNRLPDHVKPMVNALVEGRIPSSGRNGMDKNTFTQLIGLASNIDPTFDATVFNARNKTAQDFGAGGATGKKLASISTAMNHLQNFETDYNKLDNSNFAGGLTNSTGNAVQSLWDPKLQGALGSTQADINGLSGELANAFRSTGMSEHDIQEQRALLSTSASPASTKGTIEATIKLLEGKFQPTIDAYNRTMGTNKSISDFMSPQAKSVYDRINSGGALNPNGTASMQAPKAAVDTLKLNPKLRDQFDAKYGTGASAQVLGK